MQAGIQNGDVAGSYLDRILLWGMRAWMMGITTNVPVEDQIQTMFSRLGASDAAGQLYEFMWVLGHRANRTIDVDCVCSREVSADERGLLNVVALMQQDRSFEALVLLRGMLGPNAALAAAESAMRVATALAKAGKFLPERPISTSQYAFVPTSAETTQPEPVTSETASRTVSGAWFH